ncbi:hypothetical protein QYE76_066982 [Lolium multiflorum]|uniref:Uncharacterized protein n=1 Tax=Lolium multiflorum TaxID=4521 RepID=A0AAD8SBP6_LOLMU|nr:hypothetical protein QYE76_066982 [Lolium multiflorum]
MTSTDLGSAEWERSKISNQDINMLKKMGFSKKENALQFPKEESYPKPPINYRNTRGKELSGIEITAYFLRTRVQPLQARKNPFWKYAGKEDADRLWKDLPLKDFEKLIRKISSLNKKDLIPTSCRVAPFSSANPLPEGHLVLSSLPPLPEGGDVEERAVVDDDNQSTTRPATEIAGSHRSAASAESEATASTHSLPHTSKRKRDDVKDSGTSKAEEAEPSHKKAAFNPYTDALVSSDEEEEQAVDALHERPLMKEFIRLGTQFVGYRDYTKKLEGSALAPESLVLRRITFRDHQPSTCSWLLLVRLNLGFILRETCFYTHHTFHLGFPTDVCIYAYQDAATVQDLRERLHKAETSLSDNITQQSAREAEILSRLESQCRRFVRRTHQEYEVDGPVGDELLDALTLAEIHGDEARDGLENVEAGLLKLFPYFFPKKETPPTFVELAKTFNGPEDLGLKLRQEGLKIGVEGTIALTANSQQDVDWSKVGNIGEMETKKWQSLIRAAKPSARPILSFLGVKPAPAPSASKPEVK